MTTSVISENTTRDFAGVVETDLKEISPTTNSGTTDPVEVTAWSTGDNTRTLIRFSGLSNIPASAVVSSVTLELWCSFRTAGGTGTIDIYRATRAWNVAQATWNEYATSSAWATAGGRGTGDSAASTSYSGTQSGTGAYKSFSSAGLIADVQAWIDGSVTNDGWLLKNNQDPASAGLNDTFGFTSSEGSDGHRPKLTVVYSVGPALSAPTASGITSTTATIGATTDQTSGTFYVVVDTAANLSGVTATQIKAGQKASGSAALASGNSAVSTTTPSVGVTGLSQSTLYSYAAVQNNSNGDSNVLTGTFTTSAALDQSHFRWRNDDGSETTATWAAAEDTPISLAKNTPVRLRVEIGATGDPANAAYKLQYRKVGDSTWRDIN